MLNIVIPMGGKGSRFQKTHTFPKPLIEVSKFDGQGTYPMIEMVVNNLNLDGRYIFLVSREHYEKFALKYLLPLITKPHPCEIIIEEPPIYGAAYACLLAKHLIDNDDELIIANSDQWIDYNSDHFLNFVRSNDADGAIITFFGTHPKWSFCEVEEETNLVKRVVEKQPISTVANVGVYYWARGKDFVNSVNRMIADENKFNNEYYIAPSYNYLIADNAKIFNYPIAKMVGTGTPEDLERYERIVNEKRLK